MMLMIFSFVWAAFVLAIGFFGDPEHPAYYIRMWGGIVLFNVGIMIRLAIDELKKDLTNV